MSTMNDFAPIYHQCSLCTVNDCRKCPYGLFYEDEEENQDDRLVEDKLLQGQLRWDYT